VPSNSEFVGKVAVVTGAASGIGLAVAQGLISRGANVLLVDRDGDAAAAAADKLDNASAFRCDVSDPAAVEAAVLAAVELYGGIDIMINNAGVAQDPAPIVDVSPEELARVLGINVGGVFFGIKYAAPWIAKRGGGAIVSTSSGAGLRGAANISSYAASKAAVISLTQTAALELQAQNIRVNCVCPGNIMTPLMESTMERYSAVSNSLDEMTLRRQGRWGQSEDVARPIIALASDEMRFVSGMAIAVDNGASANLF
jgi:NAD(P)-dependent dehydrogenase (short-subunit alcohol dehydrogenase family)